MPDLDPTGHVEFFRLDGGVSRKISLVSDCGVGTRRFEPMDGDLVALSNVQNSI